MKNSEKAKHIMYLVKDDVNSRTNFYINAIGDLAKIEAEHEAWQKADDLHISGGLGSNPNEREVIFAKKRVAKTQEEKIAREEVLKYAIDTFLDKIE